MKESILKLPTRGVPKKTIGILFYLISLLSACSWNARTTDLIQNFEKARQAVHDKSPPNISPQVSNVKTKYSGLGNLFALANAPPRERFNQDELLIGKCVFRNDPQKLIPDILNVFVETDRILGTFVFAVPNLKGFPKSERPETHLDITRPADLHKTAHNELKNFSALQFEYPLDAPLIALAKRTNGNSGYVSYTKGQSAVNFRIRISKRTGEEIFLIEHYCAFASGCQFPNSGERYQYMEAYGYCYYQHGYEWPTQKRSTRTPADKTPKDAGLPAPIIHKSEDDVLMQPNID
jgi:hypothetical protein